MLEIKLNNINSMADIDDAKANKLVFIPIGQLVPNSMNSKELSVDDSLKESIREMGLNVPLDVIQISEGKYEITSGERRYTAFLSLIKEDPAIRMTSSFVVSSIGLIAPRLSTIRNCDRILVLDQGKIIEEGTYEELIENKGFFCELVEKAKTRR